MNLEERVWEVEKNEDAKAHYTQTLCLHAFSDLSRMSPVMFVFLLKECYVRGTLKATKKFHVLHQQLMQVLQNSPQPEPATFVVQCLYVFPVLGPLYTEGFSHLLISALRRLQTIQLFPAELSEAKRLAAKLFLDVIGGFVSHEDRILMKLLEVVDVTLENFGEAMCGPEMNNDSLNKTKAYVEPYIFGLIESQSYMMAVSLLERFSIRQSGEAFLMKMIQEKEFKAAEKWATFMGKPMLCELIQKYIDLKLLKYAYEIIKRNKLQQEFPDVYHMCKESSLKKLAEKGCWDIAERKTNNEKQLLEYLVYLAMEAGYSEKVDELCERYSLEGFVKAHEHHQENLSSNRYLNLDELVLEDIRWVDDLDGLHTATSYIEGCKVVGVDCEWKPNYVKGSKPNKLAPFYYWESNRELSPSSREQKIQNVIECFTGLCSVRSLTFGVWLLEVSIMQIASEKIVFIFDLIRLFREEPNVLDSCLKRILHSPSILKLGYNLQCDLKQLSHSYGELECFKHYEMLLDIQNVFREPRGGLSGLTKKILGASLNKTRRNSNWEERPLSHNQMEYAALDAAVLVQIFCHVRDQPQPVGVNDGPVTEWKSYIVSHMDDTKKHKTKSKKTPKSKKGIGCGTNVISSN